MKDAAAEGGFGRIYFARHSVTGEDIVVKLPFLWGKPSFDVERHMNNKVKKRAGADGPWADYFGSCVLKESKVVPVSGELTFPHGSASSLLIRSFVPCR
jgi:hypothetical protein